MNRGFLHGPVLPIYGSGAIIILFVTLPVQQDPAAGVPSGHSGRHGAGVHHRRGDGAAVQMRYWDYSSQPFNLHGYIT